MGFEWRNNFLDVKCSGCPAGCATVFWCFRWWSITATAHKLARIVYNVQRYGVAYMKPTGAANAEQV